MIVIFDINLLRDFYFVNDEPVPYKLQNKQILLIHPIKVKNWTTFERCMSILSLDKTDSNDAKIIQMSDLEYLLLLCENIKEINDKLMYVVKYCFNLNPEKETISIEKNKRGKKHLAIIDIETNVITTIISPSDFKDIRKIILYQNIYDYEDIKMSRDVKEIYNDMIQYQSENSNMISPTLEDKKIFVMGKTGIKISEINNMSYRVFLKLYDINVDVDIYYAKNIIKASQKYEVKEEVYHPLYSKRKTLKDMLFVNKETIQNKFNKVQ